MEKLTLLPHPGFAALTPQLAERLAGCGADLHAGNVGPLFDPLARRVLRQGFAAAGAHEGTVWLLDKTADHLVPAFNDGPHAQQLVGKFQQPLQSGLISMVFATERPFLENEVQRHAQQSKLLDTWLGMQTCAMIAVPFCFLKACRGVISCVQLKRADSLEPDPPGFRPENLTLVQDLAAVLAQLLEFRLLSQAVGWTSD